MLGGGEGIRIHSLEHERTHGGERGTSRGRGGEEKGKHQKEGHDRNVKFVYPRKQSLLKKCSSRSAKTEGDSGSRACEMNLMGGTHFNHLLQFPAYATIPFRDSF